MEKTHLKFCCVYINEASITQNMRFIYIVCQHVICRPTASLKKFLNPEMSTTQNSLNKLPKIVAKHDSKPLQEYVTKLWKQSVSWFLL